jgi:hypothetical protein
MGLYYLLKCLRPTPQLLAAPTFFHAFQEALKQNVGVRFMERLRQENAGDPNGIRRRRRILVSSDEEEHHLLHRLEAVHEGSMIAKAPGMDRHCSKRPAV